MRTISRHVRLHAAGATHEELTMTARTADLQNSIEGIGSAFESFQAKHDNFVADHKVRQAEIVDRLEQLEARASGPGKIAGNREQDEHVRLFLKWFSRPHDATARQELENVQSHLSRKDASIAVPSSGGYAVPEQIASDIERFELKFSPIRDLVQVAKSARQTSRCC